MYSSFWQVINQPCCNYKYNEYGMTHMQDVRQKYNIHVPVYEKFQFTSLYSVRLVVYKITSQMVPWIPSLFFGCISSSILHVSTWKKLNISVLWSIDSTSTCPFLFTSALPYSYIHCHLQMYFSSAVLCQCNCHSY